MTDIKPQTSLYYILNAQTQTMYLLAIGRHPNPCKCLVVTQHKKNTKKPSWTQMTGTWHTQNTRQ